MKPRARGWDPWLLPILLLTAATRLTLPWLWPDFHCYADECSYLDLARALPTSDGVMPPAGAERWLWAPVYPYLLYLGREWVGSPLAVRWLQLALDGVTVWALYAITARLVGNRAGRAAPRVAGLVYALHPTLAFYSGRLWSEAIYAPLLLLAAGAVLWSRDGRWPRAAVVGALVAVCVLLRGVALFVLPIFLVAVVWPDPGPVEWRRFRRWGHAAAIAIVSLAMVAPYSILSSRRYEALVISDATLGRMMWLGNNDFMPLTFDYGNGFVRDVPNPYAPDFRRRHRRTCAVVGYETDISPARIDRCEVRFGLNWIVGHPVEFVRRVPYRLAQLMNPHSFFTRHLQLDRYVGMPDGVRRALVWAVVVASAIVILVGSVGAAAWAQGAFGVMAVGIVAYQLLVIACLAGLTRYRVPLVVLWIPFTALAIACPRDTWERLRDRRARAIACAVAVALLLPLILRFAHVGFR